MRSLLLLCILLFIEQLNAQSEDPHISAAAKALEERNFQLAYSELTTSIRTKKTDFAYYLRSWCFSEMNDYYSALDDIDSALMIAPNSAHSLSAKASFLYHLKRYDEAMIFINKSINIDSSSSHAFVTRYQIFNSMGDNVAALKDIESAIRLSPDDYSNHMKRAQLLIGFKRYEEAKQASLLTFNLAKDESYLFALIGAASLTSANAPDSAIICLNYLIDKYGKNIGSLKARAEAYLALGKYKLAINDLDTAMKSPRGKTQADFYHLRGECYDSLKNIDQAFFNYNESISWDTTYALAYVGRGSIYVKKEKYNLALEDYTKAIFHKYNLGQAYYLRGLLYLQYFNDKESACKDFMGARQFNYIPAVKFMRGNCVK